MKKDFKILSECLKFLEDKLGVEYLSNPEFETIGKKGNLSDKIKARTPKIISLYRSAKKDLANNSSVSETTIEFVQLISTIKHSKLEQYFLDDVLSKLKSSAAKDYFGIKCEISVYQHYNASGFSITKIPEGNTTTPDFEINTKKDSIYIECKSILSESVKHTPRLDSFLDKLLSKINNNFVINIVLDSENANKYEPEIEKIFHLALKKQEEKIYSGKYSRVQLIKPKSSINSGSDFVIPNFNPSNSIGSLKAEIINGEMICTGGVNFLPFFPNDYKTPIARHLKKANSQIEKLGKGILHIQLPSMKVSELIKFIFEHGHRIQDYINNHSLLAVVLNIPYLIGEKGNSNEVIPDFNIPYFKYSSELLSFTEGKPFWLNSYKVIELIETDQILECEFSISSSLNSFVLFLRNTNLDVNIKLFIVNNQILHESIIEGLCNVKFSTIPKDLMKKNNKLKMKIGEVKTIYINERKLYLDKN